MTKLEFVVAVSWFISVYYSFERPWKPFNPILGETYEMVNHGGVTLIAEQVSFTDSLLHMNLKSVYINLYPKFSSIGFAQLYHCGVSFQVSHHPPIGVAHAESEHFTYDITSKVKTKFLGNSIDIYPVGR